MLLRVRTPSGSTLKLRIEPSASYASVVEQAAREAGLSNTDLHLSLEKREPLPALQAASIVSLGAEMGCRIPFVAVRSYSPCHGE